MKKNISFNALSDPAKVIIAIVLLFIVAFSIRIVYQRNSVIDTPIRADARQYFFVAYNLYASNIYSHLSPQEVAADPKPNFKRQPGYPLFLYPFVSWTFKAKETLNDFVDKVTTAQALMGAVMVVLVFLLSRFIFSIGWAILAALLTALSPHLIALDYYVLSDPLYTFMLVLGAFFVVLSFYKRNVFLSLISGILLGGAYLVRYQGILLGPFLAVVFLLASIALLKGDKKRILAKSILIFVGFLLVIIPYTGIKKSHKSSSSYKAVTGGYHLLYAAAYTGADIGLKNFKYLRKDPENNRAKISRDKSYAFKVLWDKISSRPLAYLKWYTYGKLFYLWRWDSYYVGDVYQYPMIRKGFDENSFLHFIYQIMKKLHWPLFFLSLLAPFIVIYLFLKKRTDPTIFVILISLAILLSSYVILLIMVPLPRYGLHLRPFSYLLSVYTLQQIVFWARSRLKA